MCIRDSIPVSTHLPSRAGAIILDSTFYKKYSYVLPSYVTAYLIVLRHPVTCHKTPVSAAYTLLKSLLVATHISELYNSIFISKTKYYHNNLKELSEFNVVKSHKAEVYSLCRWPVFHLAFIIRIHAYPHY